MDLYQNVKEIKKLGKIGVMFSTGKDSIVMLSLLFKLCDKKNITVIHLEKIKGLSFKEKILSYYENRYNIEIKREPHFIRSESNNKKLKISFSEHERGIRNKYDLLWCAYGYKKVDSLERRGMLAHKEFGIDKKTRRLYPLAEWSNKHNDLYIQKEKLLLPDEYKYGWRDLNNFRGEAMQYIKNNYPEDYLKIITIYPDCESEILQYDYR